RRQIKEGRASRKQPPGGHPVARAAQERSRSCTFSRNSDQTEIGDALLEDETARERKKQKKHEKRSRKKKKRKKNEERTVYGDARARPTCRRHAPGRTPERVEAPKTFSPLRKERNL
ncbi:hypothetical protein IscW_ISCW010158, partial [Ixodes scapularis]